MGMTHRTSVVQARTLWQWMLGLKHRVCTQWEPPTLRYLADDGRAYYYDPRTRVTSWDEPPGIAGGMHKPFVRQRPPLFSVFVV